MLKRLSICMLKWPRIKKVVVVERKTVILMQKSSVKGGNRVCLIRRQKTTATKRVWQPKEGPSQTTDCGECN